MGLLGRRNKNNDLEDDPFADSSGGNPLGNQTTGENDPFGSNQQSMGENDPFSNQGEGMNPHLQTRQNQFPAQELPSHIDINNPDFNQQMGIEKAEQMSPPQDFFTQGNTNQNTTSGGNQLSRGHMEKDLQIIIAKLDALKSELDSVHQRVQKIEKIADNDQQAAIEQQRKQQTYRRW